MGTLSDSNARRNNFQRRNKSISNGMLPIKCYLSFVTLQLVDESRLVQHHLKQMQN